MTTVTVLSAIRLEDGLIRGDVVVDNLLTVRGVTVEESIFGGAVALRPRRAQGDQRRVLAWSETVGAEVARAILAALPAETVAVLADDPEDICPACGGLWVSCGCTLEDADAAYAGDAA